MSFEVIDEDFQYNWYPQLTHLIVMNIMGLFSRFNDQKWFHAFLELISRLFLFFVEKVSFQIESLRCENSLSGFKLGKFCVIDLFGL